MYLLGCLIGIINNSDCNTALLSFYKMLYMYTKKLKSDNF